MSDYKPGTVAYATVRGQSSYLVSRSADGYWTSATKVEGRHTHYDWHVTDVRPLVVLDWMIHDLRQAADALEQTGRFNGTVRAIREQLRPPKPEEPGKYGAVIAGDGREWFRWTTSERRGRDWCRPGTDGETVYARWDDLEVVKVVRPC